MKLEIYNTSGLLLGKIDVDPSEIIALQQPRMSITLHKRGTYNLHKFCRVQGKLTSPGYWQAWGSKCSNT
jgi:hypothetical protein